LVGTLTPVHLAEILTAQDAGSSSSDETLST